MSTRTQADGGGGGLSVSTLLIAAASSAAAAVVTSYLWPAGSVFTAAMTPVIVTIVKEMLERPTQHISRAVGTRGSSATEPIPEAAGPAPPAERGRERPVSDRPVVADRRRAQTARPPAASRLGNGRGGGRPEGVNVYGRPPRRRRIHLGVAIVTGLLAFAIAGVVLTVPEVIFGKSVGSGDRETTFFGGKSKSSSKDSEEEQDQQTTTPEATTPQETTPEEEPSATTPQQTTPEETTPEEPPAQTPTPEAQPEGGAPAPAPQQPTP